MSHIVLYVFRRIYNVVNINNNVTSYRVLSGPVCLPISPEGFYAQQANLLNWLICDHSKEFFFVPFFLFVCMSAACMTLIAVVLIN